MARRPNYSGPVEFCCTMGAAPGCESDDIYQQREDYSAVWTLVIMDVYRGVKYEMGNVGCTLQGEQ